MECQPEETEILESSTRAHSGSSLPLTELLRDQDVHWEMRRSGHCLALQGMLGRARHQSCHQVQWETTLGAVWGRAGS